MEELNELLRGAVDGLVGRGECLDVLITKADSLCYQTNRFQINSRKLADDMHPKTIINITEQLVEPIVITVDNATEAVTKGFAVTVEEIIWLAEALVNTIASPIAQTFKSIINSFILIPTLMFVTIFLVIIILKIF